MANDGMRSLRFASLLTGSAFALGFAHALGIIDLAPHRELPAPAARSGAAPQAQPLPVPRAIPTRTDSGTIATCS